MIKAIFFDADNTLYKLNSKRAYQNLFGYLSEESEISPKKIKKKWQEILDEILNNPKKSMSPHYRHRLYLIKETLKFFGFSQKKSETLAKKAMNKFFDDLVQDIKFEKNLKNLIKELKKKYKLIIFTEEFKGYLSKKLNKIFGNWKKYFLFAITPDTIETMKPSEKYFRYALKKLKLKPSEVIVIGDSLERDIIPAKRIGIKTFQVEQKGEICKILTQLK
jgi:putative hydrolase of the HAD superfamily